MSAPGGPLAEPTGPLAPTPGQTVGPFFGFALPFDDGPRLVVPGTAGAVQLSGRVLDGLGDPVPDALLEIWQADAEGRVVARTGSLHRDGHTFTGFGRAATDGAGRYSFTTLRPGATTPGRAPFFAVAVVARGLLDRLLTRAYPPARTPAEEEELAADPLLASLEPHRRSTLLVREDGGALRWDVRLAGEHETVFLTHAADPGARP